MPSDLDRWTAEYESAERLYADAQEILCDSSSSKSAKVRKLSSILSRLGRSREFLSRTLADLDVTPGERSRRTDLVVTLTDKERRLRELGSGSDDNRKHLFKTSGQPSNRPLMDIEYTPNQADQDQMILEQDKGLDILHNVIRRQKEMAHAIGQEVVGQNTIIDDIESGMDETRQRLISTTELARDINVRGGDGAWKYWLVIILCFIVIAVLLVS